MTSPGPTSPSRPSGATAPTVRRLRVVGNSGAGKTTFASSLAARLGNLLRRAPEENIVLWAWTQHDAYRERYAALAASGLRVVRLTTPPAARRWLRSR